MACVCATYGMCLTFCKLVYREHLKQKHELPVNCGANAILLNSDLPRAAKFVIY